MLMEVQHQQSAPWDAGVWKVGDEDEGKDGDCRDGTSRAGGPHPPPPAQRMLPSWLGFPSSPSCGLPLGRGKAARGQLTAWEGEAQTHPARATPSQSSWEAWGAQTHQQAQKPPGKKKSIKENPCIKPLSVRISRAGFCICPNLALSLRKGLFVKCFVAMSLALNSPCRYPAPQIPQCLQVCQRSSLSIPSPTWYIPSSSGLSQGMSKGLKSA